MSGRQRSKPQSGSVGIRFGEGAEDNQIGHAYLRGYDTAVENRGKRNLIGGLNATARPSAARRSRFRLLAWIVGTIGGPLLVAYLAHLFGWV
jgi:hypothetical protein